MHRWLSLIAAMVLVWSAPAGAQPAGGAPAEPAGAAPAASEPAPAESSAAEPADSDPPDDRLDPMEGDESAEAAKPAESELEAASAASSFVDTRLNFTFTNENVLASPDEVHVPNVPGYRFGRPNSLGTLFFDNYDTRFSGFETLSHAVLYKKVADRGWDYEGAFVVRFNDIAERDIQLSDAGSYIRLAYWLDPARRSPNRWSLTAFPTSSDRFRLGYSYRLSWGGSDEYQRSKQAVPGVKLQYETGSAYAFLGAKSSVLLDRSVNEERAVQAYLVGAGVDATDLLRVEFNGGVFDRRTNEQEDVLREHVYLYGASVQVALQHGIPVGSSVDYKLYRNSPESTFRLFTPEEYPGGLAWMVASEATLIGQTLKDPASPGSTTVQYGAAGDINVRVKYDFTRLRLDLQYRDLAYILHTTPSLPSYVDFDENYKVAPNFFAAAGIDQHFPHQQLTVGLIVGVERPATLSSPKPIPGDTVSQGEATYVVRNPSDITILPPGKGVVVQFASKLTARLDFGRHRFASILDIYYSRDPNRTRLTRDGPEDLLRYKFDDFDQLGFNLTLQAKF